MKARVPSILVLIALFPLLFLGAGCEGDQGPAGPAGSSGPAVLSIVGGVNVEWTGDIVDELYITVGVTNAPSIPKVKVNNMAIPMYDSWLFDGGRLGYEGDIDSEIGFEEANLEVTYTMLNGQTGVATSTVTLPEEVVAYDDDIQIYPNNNVDVAWNLSNGADAYWINVYFYVRWTDDSSVTHYKYLEYDTVMTDTSLTVYAEDIFPVPADVVSLDSFNGRFYIHPVSGPWMPGVTNNIEGDGIGVFVAEADYEYVDVDLIVSSVGTGIMTYDTVNTEEEHDPPAVDIIKIAEELAGRKLR